MSDLQARIDVLRPAAGDAIVVSVPGPLSLDQVERIRNGFSADLPAGVKLLVLDARISLAHVVAPQPEPGPEPVEVEVLGFDAWLRMRTNDAHAAYMKRTSKHLVCDWSLTGTSSAEEISQFFNTHSTRLDHAPAC